MISKQEIMDILPHIRYMSAPNGKSKKLLYLGGEPEENDKILTIGKEYQVGQYSYAENREDKRKIVWSCSSDEAGIRCRVNIRNFGNFSDLRNKKINQVLN